MRKTMLCAFLSLLAGGSFAAAEEPFDYFANSWALVGLKDYLDGTRITPQNELLLANNQKLRIALGARLTPLSRRQTKTRLDGWLPVIQLAAEEDRRPLRRCASGRRRCRMCPTGKTAFRGPTAGPGFLNWVWIKATNSGPQPAEAQVQAVRGEGPDARVQTLRWSLAAGAMAEGVLREPYLPSAGDAFADAPPQIWLDRTVQFWRDLLGEGAVLETPDRKANDALRASYVDQFINNDHGVVHGGEGFYDEFYIRDGAYEVLQFEEGGFTETARRALEAVPGRSTPRRPVRDPERAVRRERPGDLDTLAVLSDHG